MPRANSGVGAVKLAVGAYDTWAHPLLEPLSGMWRDVLGLEFEIRPWTVAQGYAVAKLTDLVGIYVTGWLPGYADPEYFLRLLFQSDSRTNEGGFSHQPFSMPMSKGSRTNSTLAPERYSATKPLARFSSAPEIRPLHFTVEWASYKDIRSRFAR